MPVKIDPVKFNAANRYLGVTDTGMLQPLPGWTLIEEHSWGFRVAGVVWDKDDADGLTTLQAVADTLIGKTLKWDVVKETAVSSREIVTATDAPSGITYYVNRTS